MTSWATWHHTIAARAGMARGHARDGRYDEAARILRAMRDDIDRRLVNLIDQAETARGKAEDEEDMLSHPTPTSDLAERTDDDN